MKKNILLFIFAIGGMMTGSSQILFTYGNQAVDASEFIRAYTKNNNEPVTNKAKSIKEYLELYIRSKLKVNAAYERGIDTLPGLVAEVNNLRSQIIDKYLTDPVVLKRMTSEAFQRSQKDIHVAHIFIAYKNNSGITDTAAAQQKRDAILQRLKNGEDFLLIARQNSDDPAAKENNGDLGYITVFTLPYPFENAIYSVSPGKYTEAISSKIGYHIFKKLGERKALGKMKVQQLLLAIPPGADETMKKNIELLADSLYKRIMAGDNFSMLAKTFSNDYISAATGGNIPDVSVGEYDPVFENAIWSLAKDSAVSKPFLTSHGWHIVKRITIKPVVTDPANKNYEQELQQKIMTDGRWKMATDFIYEKVKKQAGIKKLLPDDTGLMAYSDSLLDRRPMTTPGRSIDASTPIFRIGKTTYDAEAWINYARTYRFKKDGTGAKTYPQVWEEWNQQVMSDYYRDHLEDFNEEFRNQMKEFKEGNMFFEIMQQEVWNKAQTDTTALENLYQQHKSNYLWKQSADVIIFFCADPAIAKTVYDAVKKDPSDWRATTEKYSEKVIGDSSRYEWNQIPNLNHMTPADGMITEPIVNTTDNSTSFAYILKSYPQTMPRSFKEARGMVINDYQEILEKQWDDALKKKYPVQINEKVLNSISK